MASAFRKQRSIRYQPGRDPGFERHLRHLGLQSVAEYKDWCLAHGFTSRLEKSSHKRRIEIRTAEEARIQTSLAKRPVTNRDIVADIFNGRTPPADGSWQMWSDIACIHKASANDPQLHSLASKLFCHVSDCHGFFQSSQAEVFGLTHTNRSYVDGLWALIQAKAWWLRPVETWRPRCKDPRLMFSSLARHLMAEYPVPLFMDSVWFLPDDENAWELRRWFHHLGLGANFRRVPPPVPYTTRMAHHFMQAPSHYSVWAAVRWGQIMSMGGTAKLVHAICATSLVDDFTDDEFWVSVFRFFIAHPSMDLSHVGPMIDFLKDQRRTGFYINRQGEQIEVPAPNPNFSMKGRTPQSLIRMMEDWHRRLEAEEFDDVTWESTGIPGYEVVEGCLEQGNLRHWSIRELLSSQELVAEGRTMHHCVASYIPACLTGESSIWSMRLESPDGITSQVTIEVRQSRRVIVQARGRYNTNLTGFQRVLMERWAKSSGLGLDPWYE